MICKYKTYYANENGYYGEGSGYGIIRFYGLPIKFVSPFGVLDWIKKEGRISSLINNYVMMMKV